VVDPKIALSDSTEKDQLNKNDISLAAEYKQLGKIIWMKID